MATNRFNTKLQFALGATVAGGLALAPASSLAATSPFQVAELESGYMVADSHKGEEGQCAGMGTGEEKGQEGNCAGMDKDDAKDEAEGNCAAKDKAEDKAKDKGGEGKCGEGKCAGA
ncbi:hypothetical protein [Thiohalorhabdus sp.]|uniref:hypothetical protein n=1 Tax=Thiohalorhabdus sp. TaxID=3094134 RepID=UPI002FC2B488